MLVLEGALVAVLLLPLFVAVVTLALDSGMLSLAATTNALSGKGASSLATGTFDVSCQNNVKHTGFSVEHAS